MHNTIIIHILSDNNLTFRFATLPPPPPPPPLKNLGSATALCVTAELLPWQQNSFCNCKDSCDNKQSQSLMGYWAFLLAFYISLLVSWRYNIRRKVSTSNINMFTVCYSTHHVLCRPTCLMLTHHFLCRTIYCS